MLGILGRRPRELAGLRGYICPYIFFFPYVLEMVGSHPFSTFFFQRFGYLFFSWRVGNLGGRLFFSKSTRFM